ncbi:Bestrophin, RFP-TM, chloride channel [Anatilimnocola aggregata]|uniref:Bestrophin, RFP-TM, chloride channel n=1 Tax=Anatilimnocola aggregata TaxID=2528021 RepID=A0A517YL09_9BACT|nr:bestrophin family ion channel [Anatilimnocola aggregata]QDU30915.1 Bestrophin, RFP-TM, chloride channel [Anatilimnocola aggregata]
MNRQDFWSEVVRVNGSVTPQVAVRVLIFCLIGMFVHAVVVWTDVQTGLAVAPYEIVGVVLALILVTRTNAGYDRWYEARKLWGGIVNQTRNLATIGAVYGPQDRQWQDEFSRWTAAFAHACRHSLRGETDFQDMEKLLGKSQTALLAAAPHAPMYVAGRLAQLLARAVRDGQLDRFAFMQAEHERASLIDHIGACERILKTPLAKVFSIKIRRFLFVYLVALPIAIVDKTGVMTPIIVLVVAYPLLSLDQIGIELQNPFALDRLSHLPLDEISANIERNVFESQRYLLNSEPTSRVESHHESRLVRMVITPPASELCDGTGTTVPIDSHL